MFVLRQKLLGDVCDIFTHNCIYITAKQTNPISRLFEHNHRHYYYITQEVM